MNIDNKITTTKILTEKIVRDFVENRTLAIIVKEFYSKEASELLAQWFSYNDNLENYTHEIRDKDLVVHLNYGVERVGTPFNSTYGKDESSPEVREYYLSALEFIHKIRKACLPYPTPIDKIRLELDEVWPNGANLAAFRGKKMFAGIGRIMKAENSIIASIQPHFDSVPSNIFELKAQYAVNVYLAIPTKGGELELWDVPPVPISRIEEDSIEHDWRSELPESLLIKPEVGDLILFNTRRPHAIRNFESGIRISMQSFVGLTKDEKIVFWT